MLADVTQHVPTTQFAATIADCWVLKSLSVIKIPISAELPLVAARERALRRANAHPVIQSRTFGEM